MNILRTPDACFSNLPDFPFAPHYTDIIDGLRMAHVEAGQGPTVLLLHGEPTWSFLYRKMIPGLAAKGYRAIAPDLVGFGRSDKPGAISDYTYQKHMDWLLSWVEKNQLNNITLFAQDWGSLLGLRLVGDRPDLFSRVVISNGALPLADSPVPFAFKIWRAFAKYTPYFSCRFIVSQGVVNKLPPEVLAAYNAPFPSEAYKKGPRAFPLLVPTEESDIAIPANRKAWKSLCESGIPFLTAFGTKDPFLGKLDKVLQNNIKGAQGQNHTRLLGGHFVQEDCGTELVTIIDEFIKKPS
jgi:haloalkane dehalogenase